MQFVRACTFAVVTALLAGVGAEAHAFGHLHKRHGCCGGGCHVGLIGHLHAKFHRHHGCSSCGSWGCGGGCGSCGLGGCGGGCASGDCGSGCSSCGGGGCASGDCGSGCSDCGGGSSYSTGETLTPTPAAPLAPSAPTEPPPSPEPSARRAAVRQVSLSTSADAFQLYFDAVAQHRAGDVAGAEGTLALAVAAEQAKPVSGWGRRMERVQGTSRVWLEAGRRQAGL